MEESKAFYKTVLGLDIVTDFGANVVLTGGIALQTFKTWREFIGRDDITFQSNVAELVFEEDDFDGFLDRVDDVKFVHPPIEHSWGQRVVRFYDPDGHVIEVGENMRVVTQRFIDMGLSIGETAKRMGIAEEYVQSMLNNKK